MERNCKRKGSGAGLPKSSRVIESSIPQESAREYPRTFLPRVLRGLRDRKFCAYRHYFTGLALIGLKTREFRHKHMNASWRARRAESVFKALKGALMDLSTWRGPTVRSVQFLAPTELSDNELETFGHTINASFLQPVPVIVPS
ncbi:hypothetical protein X801_09544 [Opisthorchis viverrini]|uniref:Uncharacterized protein n=1 Tax=Opisthorchis viverrini TaxID=6198 RepID=A0A1S8WJP7_OPIVI|nr:hypothetical protein X801_09544 [Opisthorchis viverrini]